VSLFVSFLVLVLGIGIAATLAGVLLRPGVFDRIIGIGVIGTKTTVLLAMIGVLYGRLDAFVDIALAYALLNFITTLVVAKYFTREEAT